MTIVTIVTTVGKKSKTQIQIFLTKKDSKILKKKKLPKNAIRSNVDAPTGDRQHAVDVVGIQDASAVLGAGHSHKELTTVVY